MKKIKFRASAKSNPQVASYLKAVNKGAKNQHVVPKDGQWAVKSANSAKATKVFDTQRRLLFTQELLQKTKKQDCLFMVRMEELKIEYLIPALEQSLPN